MLSRTVGPSCRLAYRNSGNAAEAYGCRLEVTGSVDATCRQTFSIHGNALIRHREGAGREPSVFVPQQGPDAGGGVLVKELMLPVQVASVVRRAPFGGVGAAMGQRNSKNSASMRGSPLSQR